MGQHDYVERPGASFPTNAASTSAKLVANQPLAAVIVLEIGMLGEEFRHLGLNRPRQKRTRAGAQR